MKMDMVYKVKHLEVNESIIERIGNNSFQLKGWAVTLVSIIGVLAAKETDRKFFLLAFIPLVHFGSLIHFIYNLKRSISKKSGSSHLMCSIDSLTSFCNPL